MNWFEKFDAKHPRLCTVLVSLFLLIALGITGYLDQPLPMVA
ncbi:hypothetical protein [Cupriavidus gilardii]|nr:hypothetical protein QWJ31_19680 [Cupriavidus gilardii]